MMCPITRSADLLLPGLFTVLIMVWIIGVPLMILFRLDKVIKLLEKKDRD